MDENMNAPLSPERPRDEELPLIPISPALNRTQRAQHLSHLSLQSAGSRVSIAPVNENHEETVGRATTFRKRFNQVS